ncbi:MAG TPA: cohesin domain-containing protein [Bryobacteraceae bacterium]|nr:cohesin domain-containing protein [Bryobacteraceae bacterium]
MRTRQVTSVFWLFAASTSLLAGTISVLPAAPTETVGQSFTLSVDISGASDLYGYQFDLGFDSTVLKATSVTDGAFLGTGGPTIFIPGTINNVAGSITANADILNGAVSGVNGNGDLLDVSFQALAAGSSSVQLFNLIALDSLGLGLTETTSNSTVTVTGIPEPGTWLLLGSGAAGLFAFRRRGDRQRIGAHTQFHCRPPAGVVAQSRPV